MSEQPEAAAALRDPEAETPKPCTCGMEGLHNDPHSLVGHLPLCAKMQPDSEAAAALHPPREGAGGDERLREALRGSEEARLLTEQKLADVSLTLSTTEAALADAKEERDEWMRAEHYANERQERAEAALAESRGEVERLTKVLEQREAFLREVEADNDAEPWDQHDELRRLSMALGAVTKNDLESLHLAASVLYGTQSAIAREFLARKHALEAPHEST